MCPATAGFCILLSDIQHPDFFLFFHFHVSHFVLVWITMFPFPSSWFQMSTLLSTHQYRWLIFSPGSLQLLSGYNSITLKMEATLSTEPTNLQSIESQNFIISGNKCSYLINFISLVNYSVVN